VATPEVEMLPDRIVENAHRAEEYRGFQPAAATGSARSTRLRPARFAR
jgi:hypothetical protein